MKRRLIIGVIVALAIVVASGSAYAAGSSHRQTAPKNISNKPQALGGGGATIPLTPSCERLPMTIRPAGKTVASLKRAMFAAFNIYQQQFKCDNRRIDRVIHCALDHPVTEAPADRQGFHDEKGTAAFVACVAGVTGVK